MNQAQPRNSTSNRPLCLTSAEVTRAWQHICQPIWVFSCATDRILWGNPAAVSLFGLGTVDELQSRRSITVSEEEQKQLARLREEVELGGEELVLSGAAVLPGVLPCKAITSDTLIKYKQLMLVQPSKDTTVCTLVQALPAPSRTPSVPQVIDNCHNNLKIRVRCSKGDDVSSNKGDKRQNKPSACLNLAGILGVVEDIIDGQAVDMDTLVSLRDMIVNGEVMLVQEKGISGRILSKEAFEADVGLNLMQLLSNSLLNESTDTSINGAALECTKPYRSLRSRRGSAAGSATPTASAHTGSSASPSPTSCFAEESTIDSDAMVEVDDDDSYDDEVAMVTSSQHNLRRISNLFPEMDAVLATADDWRFDAFRLADATQGHPLSALGFWLIKRAGLIDSLSLDSHALVRFLRKIESNMPQNPYHNARHAADVMQSMHVLMTRGNLLRRLQDDQPLLMLAGYLGALIHDNEHKGLNNDFLVRTGDELALTYNDASPMENYHVASAFRLMRNSHFNFLRRVPKDKLFRLRRLLIDMVLATDMKLHFNILSKFQSKLQVKLRSTATAHVGALGLDGGSNRSGAGGISGDDGVPIVDDEADRSLVMQVALKCADIGHLAAPWEVHCRWVTCLEEEFFRQGDREKAAQIPVSPLMDRSKDGITKSQVGFFDIVSLPLYHSWANVFIDATPLLKAVEENCNRWRQIEAGKAASQISR